MTDKIIYTIILLAIPFAELKWRPRIDITVENDILLWYNKGNSRTYFQIL